MNMKHLYVIAILILSCINYGKLEAADKIYMPFFELINVHEDYQYSTARLFKNYVDEKGNYTLIIPERADSMTKQPPFKEIMQTSQSLNCQYFIVADLNRIGETVIITIAMYQSSDGQMIWNDRLKANTPEDIDPILQKLAKSIGTGNKAAEDGSIYSVTNYESQNLKQIKVNQAYGASLGGVYLPGNPFTEDPFTAGGGVFWYYDARTILFEVDAQGYFLGNSDLWFGSINIYKPLYAENNTPFFGGGLGIGRTDYDNSDLFDFTHDRTYENWSGTGMMFFIGGGYIFGRTSNVGLRIHARYFVGAYKMEWNDDSYYYNENVVKKTDKYIPHGFLLNLELYFGR